MSNETINILYLINLSNISKLFLVYDTVFYKINGSNSAYKILKCKSKFTTYNVFKKFLKDRKEDILSQHITIAMSK